MLGRKQYFDAVPFFWSLYYDKSVLYAGRGDTKGNSLRVSLTITNA
jgi:hypothetical protein